MTNRITVVLLSLAIVLQIGILYRQFSRDSAVSNAIPFVEPVIDASPGTLIDVTGMPARGSSKARLVVVEFSDYACPFCQRHASEVLGSIDSLYVSSGEVRYIFANNPLPIHPDAFFLASVAICAGSQIGYWEAYNSLFSAKATTQADGERVISQFDLDYTTYERCLDDPATIARIDSDMMLATELGLSATPGFAIGHSNSTGQISVEKLVTGAQPFATFDSLLQELSE